MPGMHWQLLLVTLVGDQMGKSASIICNLMTVRESKGMLFTSCYKAQDLMSEPGSHDRKALVTGNVTVKLDCAQGITNHGLGIICNTYFD